MGTLGTILKDHWEWRGQIWRLAVFELKKQARGAALGWLWFLIEPAMYVFCFWFALDIGLKAARINATDAPYILWLTAGIIPWFFMRSMLGKGINVMKSYSYLVKKVKFPLCCISSVFELSQLFHQLISQVFIIGIYVLSGLPPDIHLLQVPVLIILMYIFWYFFSVLMSPLCAMSKDVANLMSSLSTPFFWLSGVLFDVTTLNSEILQNVLYWNPITFFVSAFRCAIYQREWVWDDPVRLGCFVIVFAFTAFCALVIYKKTNKKVADVL